MKYLFVSLALALGGLAATGPSLAAGADAAQRIPPGGVLRVTARFTPNSILAGQSTTFSWSAPGAAFCEISGVPGLSFGGSSGSLALSPTTNLFAEVTCESSLDQIGYGSASLAVQSANTPPVVNASYSPASIYTGQSSTFSWSAQYATSCSSTGSLSISGTSGSQVVTPSSNQQVTVTCVGTGGQTSASAGLTVSPAPPAPPTVFVWATPSWLYAPGVVWINWQSTNANSCSHGGPFGAYAAYVSWSSPFWVDCYGPGGYGTGFVWVTVSSFGANKQAEGEMIDTPDLSAVGIDLKDTAVSFAKADLNKDGMEDLLVFDGSRKEAHVLLNDRGQYSAINKTVSDVSRLQDINMIQVSAGKSPTITVQVTR